MKTTVHKDVAQKIYLHLDANSLFCNVQKSRPAVKLEWSRRWKPLSFPYVEFVFLYGSKPKSFFAPQTFDEKPVPFVPVLESDALHDLSIVKSVLQKSIRRQELAVALSAAKTFMTVNLKSFLRRLIIICAEDVFLYENILCMLVFLFKTCEERSESFIFTEKHYSFLLGVVYMLVGTNEYSEYDKSEAIGPIQLDKPFSVALHIFLNSTEFFLHGDKLMLMWYHESFSDGTVVCKDCANIQPIPWNSVEHITAKTCPLYAVDFHTHSRMIDYIVRSSKLDANEVKYLIWHFRSKVNKRKLEKDGVPTEEDLVAKWNLIRKTVDSYSISILSSFSS